MKELSILPAHLVTGPGAIRGLGSVVARCGRRAFVVHGEFGYDQVAGAVRMSLEDAGVEAVTTQHRGPCTNAFTEVNAERAKSSSADVVVAIGGGRVLDIGKGSAHAAGLPCVTVPTSPATCSGATAVVVFYDDKGAYLYSRLLTPPPVAAVVDTDILTQAPNRLLAAGVADALAKVYEVRFATSRTGENSATTLAALKLCDELETLIEARAVTALNEKAEANDKGERAIVSEAVLLWPALIGGLVGEANKLAAAHAVHNALTRLPGSKASLHGELVAFGILVQRVLEGASTEAIRETANFFAALDCPCSLAALGCNAFYTGQGPAIVSRAAELPSMRAAFPTMSAEDLHRAMLAADAVASAVGSDISFD